MAEIIKTTFQLRRGYEAAWKRNNPILAPGEPGFVLDRNLLKVGDGITPWNDLDYINVQAGVFTAEKVEDFPAEGSSDKLYKASFEKKLYQWNEETKTYEPLGGSELSPEQIELVVKEVIDLIEENHVQVDWNQNDETAKDYIKNKPNEQDALELVAELGLVSPVASDDGSIYTDENGALYSL